MSKSIPIGRAWASAPGKIILFGEHAVVYNRPAIAMPISQVRARAVATAGRAEMGIVLHAANLGRHYLADAAPPSEPLAFTCRTLLRRLGFDREPDVLIELESDLPIASGLGSGAATAAAVARALARWLGYELTAAQLSSIIYETEKIHHGTPSGIDNTVIAYEQPIWFVRGTTPTPFNVGGTFHWLVADTGVSSPTRHTVGDVREAWLNDPAPAEARFDRIAALVHEAHAALEQGDAPRVGALMNQNHALLVEMGVSSEENDRLADAARAAGALGAKLSGGGRGGNNLALVTPATLPAVRDALLHAGAVRVLHTTLP